MNEPSTASSLQCLVCSAPISATHFGMDACRACSAFFKRTKTTGRQYPCRQGERQCIVSNEAKFCRRCRFDKCVAVGLEYDGPMRIRRKPAAASLLHKIRTEYRVFATRRRDRELAVIRQYGKQKRFPHPIEELYEVDSDTADEISRIFVEESYALFKSIFSNLNAVSTREQELIYKDYVGKFSMLECNYRSRQLWGKLDRYFLTSAVTACDLRAALNMDHFKNFNATKEDIDSLFSSAQSYANEQCAIFIPIFARAQITERENYALLALVIGETDLPGDTSETVLLILDEYRRQALEELHEYYQHELGLVDYSTRLGNLMSINHTVQECTALFKVFFRFYATVFDMFITDKMMTNFFL